MEKQDKKMKILFILGLSHSGSTFLDMLLSHYTGAIGLGELHAVADEKTTNTEHTFDICSCGEKMKACSFWKKLDGFHASGSDEDRYKAYYQKFIEMASLEGKDIIIDSSKKTSTLNEVLKLQDAGIAEVKVIYIVKDLRSYLQSMHSYYKRQSRRWRPYWHTAWRWNKKLTRMEKNLLDKKIPHIQISYEKLCFETSAVLGEIFEFSGLDNSQFSFENGMCSHVAYGNRTKKSFQGVQDIRYSSEWMYNFWLNVCALLAFPLYKKSQDRFATKIMYREDE
ncbi:sulfotransferase [Candidatus Nomurabacteria bacterium]|nr:sulfotransferase [Candidatus Nomurabacteria bacterium]